MVVQAITPRSNGKADNWENSIERHSLMKRISRLEESLRPLFEEKDHNLAELERLKRLQVQNKGFPNLEKEGLLVQIKLESRKEELRKQLEERKLEIERLNGLRDYLERLEKGPPKSLKEEIAQLESSLKSLEETRELIFFREISELYIEHQTNAETEMEFDTISNQIDELTLRLRDLKTKRDAKLAEASIDSSKGNFQITTAQNNRTPKNKEESPKTSVPIQESKRRTPLREIQEVYNRQIEVSKPRPPWSPWKRKMPTSVF